MFHIFKKKPRKIELGQDRFSWNSIPGDKYYEIYDIIDDPDNTEESLQVQLIAAISEKSEEDILNMSLTEYTELVSKLEFLKNFKMSEINSVKNLVIEGQNYDLIVDSTALTTNQFIDYQANIGKPIRESYDKLLSIFIIPEGKTYNSGYDVVKVQEIIRTKLPWPEVQGLLNFMLRKLVQSYLTSLKYLTQTLKKMKKKDPEQAQKLEEMINQLNNQIRSIFTLGCV